MSLTTKYLTGVAVVLGAFAIALLFGGPRYAISQLPPTQRANMSDFDWIGVEWVEGAFVVGVLAVAVATSAFWVHSTQRRNHT